MSHDQESYAIAMASTIASRWMMHMDVEAYSYVHSDPGSCDGCDCTVTVNGYRLNGGCRD